LKSVGATLLRVVAAGRPGVAARVAAMPDLAAVLSSAAQEAGDDNKAKQRGLYADLAGDGTLSRPSDVTESEALEAVARARNVGVSAALLRDPLALAAFADPPDEAFAIAEALFTHWADMKAVSAEEALRSSPML
jgi:hypothetical protein